MKKIFINIGLIVIGFIIYFLQSNFFDWFIISGVKPNLFVIYVLFVGLFGSRSMGIIYGAIVGIILDFIFEEKIGPYLLGLVLVGIIATFFDKNFSKDSRITIMFMVFGTTIIFEIFSFFINFILYNVNVEILNLIKILILEVIYNIIITIILYPLMQKFGYYIENEYKGG